MVITCSALFYSRLFLSPPHWKLGPIDDITANTVSFFLENTMSKVQEAVELFKEGCDMSTPEGFAWATEQDLFKTRCSDFVRSSAEILEGLAK